MKKEMIITFDLTGQRFGRLSVVKLGEPKVLPSGQKMRTWICICDCGKETTVYQQHLTRGDTKSCGCYVSECNKKRLTTHGETKTRLYKIWNGMRQRCMNENDQAYIRYGARGISVCKEWDSFLAFKQWAISHGYRDDLTIDRINVNGNYEPCNCRWADIIVQSNNKTNSHYLVLDGRKQTMAQWAKELNIKTETLYARVVKRKWDDEKALTTPVKKYNLRGNLS